MDLMLIYGAGFLLLILAIFLVVQSGKPRSASSNSQAQSFLESAGLARRHGDHAQAAMLYEQAVQQLTSDPASDPALLSTALGGQADCMERLGKRQESELLRTRMIKLWEDGLNSGKTNFLTDIDYQVMDAEFGTSTRAVAEFYEKLLAHREKTTKPHSDEFINTVVIYSRLMRRLGEKQIADDLEQHAQKLRQGGSSQLEIKREESE